jgi:hypothetical protein
MAAYDAERFKTTGDQPMTRLHHYLWTALLSAAITLLAAPAHTLASSTSNAKESTAKKPKKEKKAKGQKAGSITFYEGSGETRAERERRLMRECRGRPNSGLCEGFARP